MLLMRPHLFEAGVPCPRPAASPPSVFSPSPAPSACSPPAPRRPALGPAPTSCPPFAPSRRTSPQPPKRRPTPRLRTTAADTASGTVEGDWGRRSLHGAKYDVARHQRLERNQRFHSGHDLRGWRVDRCRDLPHLRRTDRRLELFRSEGQLVE